MSKTVGIWNERNIDFDSQISPVSEWIEELCPRHFQKSVAGVSGSYYSVAGYSRIAESERYFRKVEYSRIGLRFAKKKTNVYSKNIW